ncbi:MAG: AAA family ATPase, partial [Coriobacteriia bacterium]|nr:AAA family ATPase [Coriobacteriia bacterium]
MSTRLFTPTQEEAEALDRRTVGRQRHLAILHERLSLAATTKTRQHTLLIGARGSGKTHLLHVALYRAQSDPAINAGLSIARIPEDAVGLTSYVDLLRQLAESKGLKVGNERNPSALEQALLEDANDRTLVLVIENLDKVFSALGEDGQSDLRSWVETSGQVLIIAASPTIVASVRNRSMPWFEGLIEMPVEGLSAEEGRELLLILANDKGDSQLVEALNSDWGEARIEVVSHLTGGSPRIWLVFFDCLTIENLDELIPAVECLVEELVPYYQTLLWDLTNTQQAIVIKLAEKESVVMTASEIAAATGHSQQTVSKQLGLLKAKRWVRDLKLPNGDQRKTWYELREPMLRHHIQWRSTGGEPLRVIIDILMNSYSSTKLRDYLSLVEPGSKVERYLAESLLLSAPVYDWVVNIGTPSALIGFARELMQGKHQVFTAEVGIYVEICAELALDPMFDVNDLISIRRSQHSELEMPLDRAVSKLVYEASKEAPLENLLLATAGEEDSDISASLKLIAAGYIGKHDLERSLEILESITVDPTSTLGIQSQVAYVTGELGNTAEALKLYQELLPLQEETLGADDRDTLDTRSMIAYYTGELSDAAEALKLYQ